MLMFTFKQTFAFVVAPFLFPVWRPCELSPCCCSPLGAGRAPEGERSSSRSAVRSGDRMFGEFVWRQSRTVPLDLSVQL